MTTTKQMARKIADADTRRKAVMLEAADHAREQFAAGVPEAILARELGVNRLTVRRWLGK